MGSLCNDLGMLFKVTVANSLVLWSVDSPYNYSHYLIIRLSDYQCFKLLYFMHSKTTGGR